jgi:hypothetical protein
LDDSCGIEQAFSTINLETKESPITADMITYFTTAPAITTFGKVTFPTPSAGTVRVHATQSIPYGLGVGVVSSQKPASIFYLLSGHYDLNISAYTLARSDVASLTTVNFEALTYKNIIVGGTPTPTDYTPMDQNLTTGFAAGGSGMKNTPTEFWRVDLGSLKYVNRISYKHFPVTGGTEPSHGRFQYSTNGTDWVTCSDDDSAGTFTKNGYDININIRYIRWQIWCTCPDASCTTSATLYEIIIWGIP